MYSTIMIKLINGSVIEATDYVQTEDGYSLDGIQYSYSGILGVAIETHE